MLSYRHAFHAGNFADVLKHWVLSHLLLAMQRKPQPFFYLDTHAGAGRYDLQSGMAQNLREFESGVARIWQQPGAPETFEPYLQLLRSENPSPKLRYYPGSPAVALKLLRPQDRAVFCELHAAEQLLLKKFCSSSKQVRVAPMDGLQALKALLPPREVRALVFMDPAYELDADYRQIPEALLMAQRRSAGAVLALWYPMLGARQAQQLPGRIARQARVPLLSVELWVRPPGVGMYGSGLLLLNPPWKLAEGLQPGLEWLAQVLGEGQGGARLHWLVKEEDLFKKQGGRIFS